MEFSPWIIMGAAGILMVVVLVLALGNIHREKRYMSQFLSEKGAALIRAVEAGARTGMMGMMWGDRQVQRLIEETADYPHIHFLAVTDRTGRFIAHSDRTKIGALFSESISAQALSPGTREQWFLTDPDDRPQTFVVYRTFRPMTRRGGHHMARDRGRRMPQMQNDPFFSEPDQAADRIIFVGLDIAPFEDARKVDMRNTIVLSAVLLLLGFAGFLSLFWAEGYRRTRQMLQDTSAFAREVVESLPVGLIATDRAGKIAFFNPAAEKITALLPEKMIGKTPEAVMSIPWCGLMPLLEKSEPVLEREMECRFAGGKSIPLSVSASRIVNEEGDLVGNILILRDLGEVRRLQEEIRRKEKLAAIGGLAAGVAHEIRNPLSSIKGLAAYFGSKFQEGSDDREAAEVMGREADRLNRAVSELLEFARPSELHLRPTDIKEVAAHALRLIRQDAEAKGIEIQLESSSEKLPQAMIDPDRISQCLLNLYLNAVEEMVEGGIMKVEAASAEEKNRVILQISDTGPGIAKDDLKKIFDPYFTTKPSGTGLGLAIVHKIVESHRGSIQVESEAGTGTRFILSLPIHPEGPAGL